MNTGRGLPNEKEHPRMDMDSNSLMDARRITLVSLSVQCPVEGGNPKDCPLKPVREWPLRDRVSWVEALGVEDLDRALAFHAECSELKSAVVVP